MTLAIARQIVGARGVRPETASAHVRNAIQLLLNVLEFGAPCELDRKELRAALHRLWLALRELDRRKEPTPAFPRASGRVVETPEPGGADR